MSKLRRGSVSRMIGKMSWTMMGAIAASALVGILAMSFVIFKTDQFLNSIRASVTAGAILEDGLEARLDAVKFRISGDMALTESFADNVAEALEGNQILRDSGQLDPEMQAAVDQSDVLIAQYAADFDGIVALRAPRNELVASMEDLGRQSREKLTEIRQTAFRDRDPVAAAFAGQAQENLLMGRVFIERFLLDNRIEDYTAGIDTLTQTLQSVDDLMVELQNPRRRQLAEEVKTEIREFMEKSESVQSLIVERNGYRAEMDAIGPEFLMNVEFVMDRLTQRQKDIGAELQRTGLILIALLAGAVGVVLLFSYRVSNRVSTYISTKIDEFVKVMADLASGNLEAQLDRAPDLGSDFARMADALDIFRTNAQERVALQEAQAQQEQEQKAEREAQQKREEAAREEAQRRIEEERLALLERLERSVGKVVENAVQGDFGERITIDFEEESLRGMAEGINRLLQNVDDGLGATSKVISALSQGDLTELMEGRFEGAFKDLQDNTNDMISALQSLVGDISFSSESLASSSNELQSTSDALSKQAEENAASLEETSAALEELTESIKTVSENVDDANRNAREVRQTAQTSSVVAAEAAASMGRISEASKEIANVATVINDISFQINLLALNAGVEAARAGEEGRGFSVVASEVRQLAQRAGEAAAEIDKVILRSEDAVSEGVSKVTDARASLDKISESVVGVSDRIEHISNAISEQVDGIGEINAAVAKIDGNTQKQVASFEEVTAASKVLSHEAGGLKSATARFRTSMTGPAVLSGEQTYAPSPQPEGTSRRIA